MFIGGAGEPPTVVVCAEYAVAAPVEFEPVTPTRKLESTSAEVTT